jgi:DNA-binding GntR family transcriptional regulator
MGKSTLRDEVWMFVMSKAVKGGKAVTPAEIAETTGASERMVRQCLLSIMNTELIERRTNRNGEVQYLPSAQIEWTPEQ